MFREVVVRLRDSVRDLLHEADHRLDGDEVIEPRIIQIHLKVHLGVPLEHVEDLIEDFEQAFAHVE